MPLPLEGIRVLDFCVVWAGPLSTMLLGDLGAEVIKVENPNQMQPMTRGTMARVPKELAAVLPPAAGGFPEGDPGEKPFNYHPTFVSVFRNKKSVTMDFRTPEGRELLGRLVAESDVIVENNATETMDGLGITYEWLRSLRPDIIMLRIPAYGSTGPYNQARALGVHLESVMGHTAIRGYADLDPTTSTPVFSGDYLAGTQAALAVMLALRHRRKTGRGQLIELAQAETASAMLFQGFMDYLMNGRVPARLGNRSITGCAPAGVYPCRSEGPASECGDRWIAIEVIDDAAWRALVEVMGSPDWARETDLATVEGRRARHDFLDEQIAAWTKDFDDYELFHRLQRAGVACAPVVNSYRIMDDEHVLARNLYQPQVLAGGVGPYRFTTPVFRFSETPITVRQPSVALGEHNEYVYREVIGVTAAEFEHYRALGHVATDFNV